MRLWYCDTVKNLTVAIPDDVYRQARIRAAEAGTSVSALVTLYLKGLAADDAEFERLAGLEQRLRAQIEEFLGGDRLERDEAHDRALR